MASTEDDEIVGASDGLAIAQRTDTSGGNPYERSPFEAAVPAASKLIKAGHRVSISVEGAREGESDPGKRQT